jgi:hypothetical protein
MQQRFSLKLESVNPRLGEISQTEEETCGSVEKIIDIRRKWTPVNDKRKRSKCQNSDINDSTVRLDKRKSLPHFDSSSCTQVVIKKLELRAIDVVSCRGYHSSNRKGAFYHIWPASSFWKNKHLCLIINLPYH